MHKIRHLYTFIQLETDPIKRKIMIAELKEAVSSLNLDLIDKHEMEELKDICCKMGIELNIGDE